jgi:hypothetical protein
VRLCAEFTDTVLATFPLFLLGKILPGRAMQKKNKPSSGSGFTQSKTTSALGAVCQKLVQKRLAAVPDELCAKRDDSGELLEIRCCRSIPEWVPPRIIRYEDAYYRLEASAQRQAPRPFVYTLRKLSTGVPGRTVLTYSPKEQPIRVDR